MSLKIRGQEVLLKLTIDGQPGTGSWLKAKDWKVTPRTEITEQDYLGETESDLDIQHHGYDFQFSVDELDDKILRFIQTTAERESEGLRPQQITMTVINNYRESSNVVADNYYDVFMKVDDRGAGGRKEMVSATISGKCKKKNLITAA